MLKTKLKVIHSIQVFHAFMCNSQIYQPHGAMDHLMNCRPRPTEAQTGGIQVFDYPQKM